MRRAAVKKPSQARLDDTGAMPLAMLLTLVGVLLSAVLASIVSSQMGSTRNSANQQHALDAAQAGLDVAVGHIRAANDGPSTTSHPNNGVIAMLPCGPFNGLVEGSTGDRYSVSITYLTKVKDPITCNPMGGGTSVTPVSASLVSVGTDATTKAVRTLNASYTFRTTNQNIPGGLVHVYQTATSDDLCLDAGTGSPAANTILVVQPCSAGSDQQTFAYNNSLNLVLVSSVTKTVPTGMCLDAGAVPHTTGGVPVRFQPCGAAAQPRQQWGFNDMGNFEGTSDGDTLDGYCFNVSVPNVAGSTVVLGTDSDCMHLTYDNMQTFSPEAAVGAGAASAATSQLVNYAQFGRCLDVTERTWNYGYMIVWPCKQSPDPTLVLWNQKWQTPAVATSAASATAGTLSTNPGSTKCLRSPMVAAGLVDLIACPGGAPPTNLKWKVYGDTGAYSTSYTIVDASGTGTGTGIGAGNGLCLAAGPPPFYPSGQRISKAVVQVCNGSTAQKWNANADVLKASPLKDIRER